MINLTSGNQGIVISSRQTSGEKEAGNGLTRPVILGSIPGSTRVGSES